jgi:hypothetical protein
MNTESRKQPSDRAATRKQGQIIPKLPDRFHPTEGDAFPAELIKAKIVRFGTTEERVEGGGLVIDYRPCGSNEVRRLHLGFNELGMWIHRQSILDEC